MSTRKIRPQTSCWTTSGQQTFESSLLSQWQVDVRSSLATESTLLTVFHFLIWKLSEGLSVAVLMPEKNKSQGTRVVQSLRGKETVWKETELKILSNLLDSLKIEMRRVA